MERILKGFTHIANASTYRFFCLPYFFIDLIYSSLSFMVLTA